jgi:hypothetical protein
MLLDPAFARKRGGNDLRRIMVAVTAQITDGDVGVGQAFLDQAFDFGGFHGHWENPRKIY